MTEETPAKAEAPAEQREDSGYWLRHTIAMLERREQEKKSGRGK